MGIFRTKNSTVTNDIVSGLTNTASLSDVLRSSTEAPVTEGDLTYYGDAIKTFQLRAEENITPKLATNAGGDMVDWWDIAQSHFFTVQIFNSSNGAGLHDDNGQPFNFSSGEGTYKNYIPIKSMNFNYTSYDNMNIPFGIFGDFPLLHKKKVTSISFSCYDLDQDSIEKALRYWEQQCFPKGMYVAYLADVAATLKYTSYDVKGRENFTKILEVIPASTVSVSRSYEENSAKLLNFSVVAVGAPGASATTGESVMGGGIAERGFGDGNYRADRAYETKVSALIYDGRYREPTVLNYADQ